MKKIIGWILLLILALIPGTVALQLAANAELTGKLYFGSIVFAILLYLVITLINKTDSEV